MLIRLLRIFYSKIFYLKKNQKQKYINKILFEEYFLVISKYFVHIKEIYIPFLIVMQKF